MKQQRAARIRYYYSPLDDLYKVVISISSLFKKKLYSFCCPDEGRLQYRPSIGVVLQPEERYRVIRSMKAQFDADLWIGGLFSVDLHSGDNHEIVIMSTDVDRCKEVVRVTGNIVSFVFREYANMISKKVVDFRVTQ